MTGRLSGKVALATGASRGIGAAIAVCLAAEGADVAISYAASPDRAARVVGEIEAKGARGLAVSADQADPEAVAELVRTLHTQFGRLDILVHNAGVFITGTIDSPDTDVAAQARQFAINVGGVAAAVRAAAALLPDSGRIISIGSLFGPRSPWTGIGGYSATKSAPPSTSTADTWPERAALSVDRNRRSVPVEPMPLGPQGAHFGSSARFGP